MYYLVNKSVKILKKMRRPSLPKEKQLEMPAPMIKDVSDDHEIDVQQLSGSASEVINNLNEFDPKSQFVIRFEDTYRW